MPQANRILQKDYMNMLITMRSMKLVELIKHLTNPKRLDLKNKVQTCRSDGMNAISILANQLHLLKAKSFKL